MPQRHQSSAANGAERTCVAASAAGQIASRGLRTSEQVSTLLLDVACGVLTEEVPIEHAQKVCNLITAQQRQVRQDVLFGKRCVDL